MRPSQQREILETSGFSPKAEMLHAFAPDTPWDGNIEVFATHPSFCGEKLYPRQVTLLKLIYLQTEIMTDYDFEVIEEWRRGFFNPSMAQGVQPDIWERVEYLKSRGYRRFPHIEAVIGRRGSKGKIGGILGAETMAYMYSLDDWQAHYGISPGKDGYLSVVATGKTQATKFQFADIREAITNCEYLQPAISKNQTQAIHVRTPADLRRIAYLRENNIPADYEIATLRAVPMSSQSSTGRGATGFANFFDEFAHMLAGSSSRSGEEVYECLAPDTPIKMADGSLREIKDIQVGDEVLSVDEKNPDPGCVSPTKVVDKWGTTKEEKYEIEMEDGTVVVCSGNHGWLTQRGWVLTCDLTEDDDIIDTSPEGASDGGS